MQPVGETLGLAHHRPLLGVAKARLVATCETLGLTFVRDPFNMDTRFARARLRRLMPLLAGEGLTAERLARLARRMGEIAAMVEGQARAALDEAWRHAGPDAIAVLAFKALATAATPVRQRALAIVIEEATGKGPALDNRPVRLERLEALDGALMEAAGRNAAARRTLGGLVMTLDTGGLLTIRRERPRSGATNRSRHR